MKNIVKISLLSLLIIAPIQASITSKFNKKGELMIKETCPAGSPWARKNITYHHDGSTTHAYITNQQEVMVSCIDASGNTKLIKSTIHTFTS